MIKIKKIIIILFIFTLAYLTKNDMKSKNVLIPKEAIRYRIIANSNSKEDQILKEKANKLLEPNIKDILAKANNIEESRNIINSNITNFANKLNDANINHKINYGLNYFPSKIYKNVEYPSGNYESLVITIGEGLGDNWWCVLFPPLCLIEATENESENIKFDFYIKNVIEKYSK